MRSTLVGILALKGGEEVTVILSIGGSSMLMNIQ